MILSQCYICGKPATKVCRLCGRPVCEEHSVDGLCVNCARGKLGKE